jgi:hypothetical protein
MGSYERGGLAGGMSDGDEGVCDNGGRAGSVLPTGGTLGAPGPQFGDWPAPAPLGWRWPYDDQSELGSDAAGVVYCVCCTPSSVPEASAHVTESSAASEALMG